MLFQIWLALFLSSSFCKFLEFVVLVKAALFIVILISFKFHDVIPDLVGFVPQLVGVHFVEGQRLNTDVQGDLALFFDLFLGLGEFFPGVHGRGGGLLATLLLLGSHHLLSLDLSLLHLLLLLGGLSSFLGCLGFLHLLFLLSLLPGQLFLLFSSDLLPLGLLLLQPLQLSLLLGPLISPLVDILLQLFVELASPSASSTQPPPWSSHLSTG